MVEIFVIIFGVKYVVDMGFVKEMCYDFDKKVNLLKVVKIIKSFVD